MTPKKQLTTGNGTTAKSKSIATARGIISPSVLNLSSVMEEFVFIPSQWAAGDTHLPSTYEGQLLQIFTDMKEEMAKQQSLFDREREQASLDLESVTCEWEELKYVNDQLLARIIALQSTQGSPPLPEGPTDTETQDGKYTQSQRHRRTIFPIPSEQTDSGSDSSHLRTRCHHDHTRRKTEEFVCVQDINKLIQK